MSERTKTEHAVARDSGAKELSASLASALPGDGEEMARRGGRKEGVKGENKGKGR